MQDIPLLLPTLVLLLTTGVSHCLVHCPAECRGPGWVVVPGKGLEKFEGPKAQALMTVIKKFQMVRPGTTTVRVTINGHEFQVPSGSKVTILDIIKRFPEIGGILPWFIQSGGPGGWTITNHGTPGIGGDMPWFPHFPIGVGTPEEPHVPEEPSPPSQPRVPSELATTQPLVPEEPAEPTHVSIPELPVFPELPEIPPVPEAPPVPELPELPVAPGFPEVPVVPEGPEATDVPEFPTEPIDVNSYLELLQKNPDLFFLIYRLLVHHGVKFPDLTKPIRWVFVHGEKVPLQSPVFVRYDITINNNRFELPKDRTKFANFVSSHPHLLPQITTILQQFGSTLMITPNGQLTGFKFFDLPVELPRPVRVTVTVNGKRFKLPQDIIGLIGAIQHIPKFLHLYLPLLASYNVRTKKGPNGEIHYLIYKGQTYPVEYVQPVKVTIDNTQFSIPADLGVILTQPNKLWVGQLLTELQKQHVPITVDSQTGNLIGIVINQVPIPFPVIVRLRVKLGNRYFVIPKDIPAIINFLQKQGLPSEVLNDLYSLYGIIPVRNPDRLVVAIEFNGKRYPVPQQKTTTLVVDGQTFVLPRDNDRLAEVLVNRMIPVKDFLLQIQLAGYKLLAGPDGVLSSVQKGFEIFQLPVTIRLEVTINNDRYRVPNDLPKLIEFMSQPEHSHVVEQVIQNLIELGVQVKRDGGNIVLVFNGREYHVSGGGGSPSLEGPGYVNVPEEPTMRIQFNGKWFTIPDEFDRLVATVREGGNQAITFFVKSVAVHKIIVNRSPDGDIASILFRGKTYNFPRASGGGGGSLKSGNVEVTIRGQRFLIPRDMGLLPKRLRRFEWGELVVALHRLGIMLEVDDRGRFYGMRVGGQLVKFSVIFKVNIMLDNSGASFGVPHQLREVANGLSIGNWNWNKVRSVLIAAGAEIRGGASGPPMEIGFQGTFYKIQRGVKG